MAAGWISLLKQVPWTVVLARAPDVADSARKLWNTVGRKQTAEDDASVAEEVPQEHPLVAMEARLGATEDSVSDLRTQMAKCSELLSQLAEQNSLLVARMEVERRRKVQVAVAAGVSLVVALIALFISIKYS